MICGKIILYLKRPVALISLLSCLLFFCLAANRINKSNSLELIPGSGIAVLESDPAQLAANRKILESMTSSELAELKDKKARFDALSETDRDRIRRLHHELQSSPDQLELVNIMRRYMDWLPTLEPQVLAAMLDLKTVEEKVEEICRLRCSQSRSSHVLSDADNLVFEDWFSEFANAHPEEIRQAMNRIRNRLPARFRTSLPDDTAEPETLLRSVILDRQGNEVQEMIGSNIEELAAELSSGGRGIVMHGGDPIRVLRMLITNPVSDFELRRFSEEKLTAAQRAALDRLSPDEMKRQMGQLYLRDRLGMPIFDSVNDKK